MVVVQVLAFGRVQDNRVQRRERKASKAEKEKTRRELVECAADSSGRKSGKAMNGGLDGAADDADFCSISTAHEGMNGKAKMNRVANMMAELPEKVAEGLETESEASLTETSDEEMMI